MKIRIVDKGWAGFSGELGTTIFVDGVSVDDVSATDIERIGASVLIEHVGAEGVQIGPASMDLASYNLRAIVESARSRKVKPAVEAVTERTVVKPEGEDGRVWTLDELGEVADSKGIAGLREIAAPLNLRARGVHELMQLIVKTQSGTAAPARVETTHVEAVPEQTYEPVYETVSDAVTELSDPE